MTTPIATRPLKDGEELRVELSDYRGQTYLAARRWWRDRTSGEWKPGKGLSVRVELLPWLRAALEQAETQALAAGLLDEESFEAAGLPLPASLGGAA